MHEDVELLVELILYSKIDLFRYLFLLKSDQKVNNFKTTVMKLI